VEEFLKKAARGQIPVLRAELTKIEMGIPKRREVFRKLEQEWLVRRVVLSGG
jgi:hypothetical protein